MIGFSKVSDDVASSSPPQYNAPIQYLLAQLDQKKGSLDGNAETTNQEKLNNLHELWHTIQIFNQQQSTHIPSTSQQPTETTGISMPTEQYSNNQPGFLPFNSQAQQKQQASGSGSTVENLKCQGRSTLAKQKRNRQYENPNEILEHGLGLSSSQNKKQKMHLNIDSDALQALCSSKPAIRRNMQLDSQTEDSGRAQYLTVDLQQPIVDQYGDVDDKRVLTGQQLHNSSGGHSKKGNIGGTGKAAKNMGKKAIHQLSTEFKAGQAVWAKVSKYPWWPAITLPTDSPIIPASFKRPSNSAHHIPVRFFGTYDFAWVDQRKNMLDYASNMSMKAKTKQRALEGAVFEANAYAATGRLPDQFSHHVSTKIVPTNGSFK